MAAFFTTTRYWLVWGTLAAMKVKKSIRWVPRFVRIDADPRRHSNANGAGLPLISTLSVTGLLTGTIWLTGACRMMGEIHGCNVAGALKIVPASSVIAAV